MSKGPGKFIFPLGVGMAAADAIPGVGEVFMGLSALFSFGSMILSIFRSHAEEKREAEQKQQVENARLRDVAQQTEAQHREAYGSGGNPEDSYEVKSNMDDVKESTPLQGQGLPLSLQNISQNWLENFQMLTGMFENRGWIESASARTTMINMLIELYSGLDRNFSDVAGRNQGAQMLGAMAQAMLDTLPKAQREILPATIGLLAEKFRSMVKASTRQVYKWGTLKMDPPGNPPAVNRTMPNPTNLTEAKSLPPITYFGEPSISYFDQSEMTEVDVSGSINNPFAPVLGNEPQHQTFWEKVSSPLRQIGRTTNKPVTRNMANRTPLPAKFTKNVGHAFTGALSGARAVAGTEEKRTLGYLQGAARGVFKAMTGWLGGNYSQDLPPELNLSPIKAQAEEILELSEDDNNWLADMSSNESSPRGSVELQPMGFGGSVSSRNVATPERSGGDSRLLVDSPSTPLGQQLNELLVDLQNAVEESRAQSAARSAIEEQNSRVLLLGEERIQGAENAVANFQNQELRGMYAARRALFRHFGTAGYYTFVLLADLFNFVMWLKYLLTPTPGMPPIPPIPVQNITDVITQVLDSLKPQLPLAPTPQAPLHVPKQVNDKLIKEAGGKVNGYPEVQLNAYGPYNAKLPSLTLRKMAYANQRRSDPDFTRTLDDNLFDEAMKRAKKGVREQGLLLPLDPGGIPPPEKKPDQQIMLYDPYTEIPFIPIKDYNNARGYTKVVPIKDQVPGDEPPTVDDGKRQGIFDVLKAGKYAYNNLMQTLHGIS